MSDEENEEKKDKTIDYKTEWDNMVATFKIRPNTGFPIPEDCFPVTQGSVKNQLCFSCFRITGKPFKNHFRSECHAKDLTKLQRRVLTARSRRFAQLSATVYYNLLVSTREKKDKAIQIGTQRRYRAKLGIPKRSSIRPVLNQDEIEQPKSMETYMALKALTDKLKSIGVDVIGNIPKPLIESINDLDISYDGLFGDFNPQESTSQVSPTLDRSKGCSAKHGTKKLSPKKSSNSRCKVIYAENINPTAARKRKVNTSPVEKIDKVIKKKAEPKKRIAKKKRQTDSILTPEVGQTRIDRFLAKRSKTPEVDRTVKTSDEILNKESKANQEVLPGDLP